MQVGLCITFYVLEQNIMHEWILLTNYSSIL